MRHTSTTVSEGTASRLGRRVVFAALALLAALWVTFVWLGVAGIGEIVSSIGRRVDECAGCAAAPSGAGVVRGERAVAWIRQIAQPLPPDRPVALYLADGSDPALDSARAGLLVAVADPGMDRRLPPVLALVPRDSASGLPFVGRIVTRASREPIPVYELRLQPPRQ